MKTCNSWGYSYGEKINIKSKSLNNNAYNLTFNGYVYSGLGAGTDNYFNSITVSNQNANSLNVIAFNNGKSVGIDSPIKCENLTTDNIDLLSVKIDYYGTINNSWISNGSPSGIFATTLPIELLSFDASANLNKVDLTWATASEKNNDFFTIERTIDGIDFEEIARIAGQGNSSIKNEYAFTDVRPKNGVSYYRLKQTDYNGESEYFEVKSVNIQKGDFVSNVYPNPAVMNRTTVFVEKTSDVVSINVRNLLGQLIYSKEIDASSNDVAEEIELTGSDKMFFVELIQNNKVIARHKILNQ